MTGIRKKVLIVVVNVAVLAVLLEVGAYIAYPMMFEESLSKSRIRERLTLMTEQADPNAAYQTTNWLATKSLHPYLGYTVRPGFRNGADRGFFVEPYRRHEPQDDRVVIAISGGSVAAAVHEESRDTIVATMREIPQFADAEIVVRRFAVGGYKQPQQLMALNFELVQGNHFDYWINLDGFNEVALPLTENLGQGLTVSYPRSWSAFAVGADDKRSLRVNALMLEIGHRRARYRGVAQKPVLRSSAFCLMLWQWMDARAAENGRRHAEETMAAMIAEGLPESISGPRPLADTPEAVLNEAVDIWSRSSRQMAAVCDAFGIRYMHFLQPNQYADAGKVFTRQEQVTALGPEDHPYRRSVEVGYPRLQEAGSGLQRSGVAFFDLTDVFDGVDDTIYVDTCCHTNPDGYDLMARAIVAAIQNSLPATPEASQ